MEKKEELFHKLDKRHEKHQEIKDRNREARRDADESKTFLQHLNDWIVKINDSIDEEIEKKNTYIGQKILDEISEDMQKLDSYFIEHSSALKKFDMKKVQESILDLRSKFDELHRVLIPKKKFGFKGNKMKKAIVSNASLKSGRRLKPNILIAGTPGTGKSSLCKRLKDLLPADENVKVINLGEFAKENDFLGDWDDKYESHEIDEDKVLDELEDIIQFDKIPIIDAMINTFDPNK